MDTITQAGESAAQRGRRAIRDAVVGGTPPGGPLVRASTAQGGQEMAEVRHLLVDGGVRAASPTAPAGSCARSEAPIDAQQAAVREQDHDALVELCMAFHRGVVEVGGNGLPPPRAPGRTDMPGPARTGGPTA